MVSHANRNEEYYILRAILCVKLSILFRDHDVCIFTLYVMYKLLFVSTLFLAVIKYIQFSYIHLFLSSSSLSTLINIYRMGVFRNTILQGRIRQQHKAPDKTVNRVYISTDRCSLNHLYISSIIHLFSLRP
jgi:hypothetical protein